MVPRNTTAVSTVGRVDCSVRLAPGFGGQRHANVEGCVRLGLSYLNALGWCVHFVCGPGKRVWSAGTNGGKFYSAPVTLSF